MKFTSLLKIMFWSSFLLFTACRREEVDIAVTADFTYEVVDADYSIPVRIVLANNSTGGQFYKWTFEGGTPETYDKRDPGYVIFNKPGNIKIKLEVWNDSERKEKEITIVIDSVVNADFDIAPVINNYGPTEFRIINKSGGAAQYNWWFANGTPATATEEVPSVTYAIPGEYKVLLEIKNSRGEKDTFSKRVTVLPALSAPAFDIVPSSEDNDMEAPLTASLQNHTTSATIHQWTASGGTLSSSTDFLPSITFTNAGTYTITYKASNGKQTGTVSRTITVKPNSNLLSFTEVHLGINTAHATIGSFFSTQLGKVLKQSEVNSSNGSKIDLVFFGLTQSFSYNLFVSPDSAASWTFAAIPGATATKFINIQETCGCSTLSAADFDAVTNGSQLQSYTITVTPAGSGSFTNGVVPRVVLFQNQSGKKGAIKIKQFVQAGQQSYIVCDIKVQKD